MRNEFRYSFPTWMIAVFLVVLGAASSHAQSYSLNWQTIDGGGGTSTGGVYTVSGTIGQPDAGTMSGGGFTLQGGFWGVVAAIQTTNAPMLQVTRTDTNTVVISWALSGTPWQLQAASNVLPIGTNWRECIYQTNGVTCLRIEPASGENRFFRLWY